MNKDFLRVSTPFMLFRLVVSIAMAVVYILVAAGVQYLVVSVLGETTFNYIFGGLASLIIGVVACKLLGALIFMFVKGWHVSALAYAPKIIKNKAPAFEVGTRAFKKYLWSFAAVYGARIAIKEVISKVRGSLWDMVDGIPYINYLRRFSDHPIVRYISSDVLHYGFDATIYYIIRYPKKDESDMMTKLTEAAKNYLYCIPKTMLSSVKTYIMFRFIPKVLKYLLILYVLFTNGIVAGILITVLMFPIFYILDNALFDPLTMVTFLSSFAKQCEKGIDKDSKVAKMIDSCFDGQDVGLGSEDIEDLDEEEKFNPKDEDDADTDDDEEPKIQMPKDTDDDDNMDDADDHPPNADIGNLFSGMPMPDLTRAFNLHKKEYRGNSDADDDEDTDDADEVDDSPANRTPLTKISGLSNITNASLSSLDELEEYAETHQDLDIDLE